MTLIKFITTFERVSLPERLITQVRAEVFAPGVCVAEIVAPVTYITSTRVQAAQTAPSFNRAINDVIDMMRRMARQGNLFV
jgi:hypothetical protein